MIALASDVLIFDMGEGEGTPFSAEMISVELMGVIWKTPIRAERMNPILLPVALTIFSARSFAFSVALASISTLSSSSLV